MVRQILGPKRRTDAAQAAGVTDKSCYYTSPAGGVTDLEAETEENGGRKDKT